MLHSISVMLIGNYRFFVVMSEIYSIFTCISEMVECRTGYLK